MPYRTQYGSHYHETYGCHGATIPCGTEGLTPCSDCCGAGNGTGTTGGGTVTNSYATGSQGSGYYGRQQAQFDASTNLRQEIIKAMVTAFANQGTGAGEPQGPTATKEATSGYASQGNLGASIQGAQYDPQADARRVLSSPQSARYALTMANAVAMQAGGRRTMPRIDAIGSNFRESIGNIRLALSERARSQRLERAVRRTMRNERCDEYTARCVVAAAREDELERSQRAATEYVRNQMAWSNATSTGRRVTFGDVVCGRMAEIGQRAIADYGLADARGSSISQTMALARSIQASIEEGGYADKITPGLIDRMRTERGLSKGEGDSLTIAMEWAMHGHWFRTGQARQVAVGFRRRQATMP